MTEVLYSSSSSPSPSISTPTHQSNPYFLLAGADTQEIHGARGVFDDDRHIDGLHQEEEEEAEREVKDRENKERRDHQLSLLALLVTLFRKGFWMACKTSTGAAAARAGSDSGGGGGSGLEIGWPTNVRHVAHVTFDRFNGFLGLPVEFEPEVPSRAPSASTTVFGVSTESMQLSFDSRGNSVPMILLLMQKRLYAQGGLQAEGIFRINAENSQEEYLRNQLNRGIVPEDIDVHCLAGLIKAWFRELPRGVLDPLSSDQVMQCQSEEECASLVRLLPPSEAGLLDWAINLMADVVQLEQFNKMNARNIAVVFAPNMTQMSDPVTALMYAVQVMNFLRCLIERTLKEREELVAAQGSTSNRRPSDGNGQESPQLHLEDAPQSDEEAVEHIYAASEPEQDSSSDFNHVYDVSEEEYMSYSTSATESGESGSCGTPIQSFIITNHREPRRINGSRIPPEEDKTALGCGTGGCASPHVEHPKKLEEEQPPVVGMQSVSKEISNLCRINSAAERFEAWR